jgi:hypothetical protein
MNTTARVILTAEDRTKAAFASAQRGMDSLGYSASAATKFIGGLAAAFSAGAIANSIRNTANFADEQGKLAQRAGETAAEYSRLSYAARQADVDNNELAKGLRQLGADAADGGKKLATLGISARDNEGKLKSNAQLFRELADVIASTEDPQKRATLAAQALGEKLGPQLVPLLAQGSGGLKSLGDEAARFGRVVDDQAVKAAELFNDNLTKLSEAGAGLAQRLSGPVIESLANTSSYFIKVANDVGIARASLITFGAAVARTLGVDDVGKLQSQARANQNAVSLTFKQIETFQRLADRGDAAAASRVAALRDQFARLQSDGQRISAALAGEAVSIEGEYKPVSGSPLPPPLPSGGISGATGSRSSAASAAQREAERREADYQQRLRDYSNAQDAYVQSRHAKRLAEQEATEKTYLQDLADFENAQREYVWQRNVKRVEDEQKAQEDAAAAVIRAQEEQAGRLRDAFSSTFNDLFTQGMKFGDLLKKLAFDAINIQFLTPAAQKAGSAVSTAFTALFNSFDGGGYTGAGSRSGGLDGKGGFMAMLHPNETVLDHTRGQGMGGGMSFSYTIDARGADAGVEQRVRVALAETEARIRAAIVPTVVSAAGRGGSVAKALGRA